MFPLHSEILAEKYCLLSWMFRELTLFRVCLHASIRTLDLLLRAAVFSLSLVIIRLLKSLPSQGQYLSETRISFKGACFSMTKENKEDQLLTSIYLRHLSGGRIDPNICQKHHIGTDFH